LGFVNKVIELNTLIEKTSGETSILDKLPDEMSGEMPDKISGEIFRG
jgi:hypothetical protein